MISYLLPSSSKNVEDIKPGVIPSKAIFLDRDGNLCVGIGDDCNGKATSFYILATSRGEKKAFLEIEQEKWIVKSGSGDIIIEIPVPKTTNVSYS